MTMDDGRRKFIKFAAGAGLAVLASKPLSEALAEPNAAAGVALTLAANLFTAIIFKIHDQTQF